jgi:hypothetical protein
MVESRRLDSCGKGILIVANEQRDGDVYIVGCPQKKKVRVSVDPWLLEQHSLTLTFVADVTAFDDIEDSPFS